MEKEERERERRTTALETAMAWKPRPMMPVKGEKMRLLVVEVARPVKSEVEGRGMQSVASSRYGT